MQDAYDHPDLASVTLAEALHALSDPVRLSVVVALRRDGTRNWGCFEAPVSPATLSHHMKVLRGAGLILSRKEGTRCQVSLRPGFEERFPGLLAAITGLVADA